MPARSTDSIVVSRGGSLFKAALSEVVALMSGGGGSSFLPRPDRTDYDDSTHSYLGWADVDGRWLIQRRDRTTRVLSNTRGADLSGFDAAWADRANQEYA